MTQIFGFLGMLTSIYMMVLFFRIILTWFPGTESSGITKIVSKVTDPYLDWFRRLGVFRLAALDLSAIAALGSLSIINRILITLAERGSIKVGIILAIAAGAIWGVVSFLIWFLIIILAIRLAAHALNLGTDNHFLRVVDMISGPVIFKINSLLLKERIVGFVTSIIVSIAALGISFFVLRAIVVFMIPILEGLPV